MARRKKKESPQESLIKLVMVVGFLIGVTVMKDIWSGVFLGLLFVGLIAIGMIVFQVRKNNRLKAAGIADIDKMNGVEFEEFLKVMYKGKGFDVRMTPTSGDFGADLVLQKNNRRIVVQAKRYSKSVGIKAVQEIIPALRHYNAQEAWVVTNSHFTKAAQELASTNDVKLIGRDQLVETILVKNLIKATS